MTFLDAVHTFELNRLYLTFSLLSLRSLLNELVKECLSTHQASFSAETHSSNGMYEL
jgi:hypothetical protein